ncbi:MAG: hypothetical protein ACREK5_11940 [Gemmatimonadota bacterium]
MTRRTPLRPALVALIALSGLVSPLPAQESGRSLHEIAVAVAEAERACRADDQRLWGLSLCGPLLFADTAGDRLIASRDVPEAALERTPEGLYVAPLPDDLPVANTAIDWADVEWAMVVLPLPDDPTERRGLLIHESFHRIQDDLGLTATGRAMDHLSAEDGRVWLRLELRALGRALAADSVEELEALKDALAFRARRQALAPGAREAETALELQEGLAAYTGAVLAVASREEAETRVVELLDEFDDKDSYARSFAYATGPALGLLADRYAPGWRETIGETRDLAGVLAREIDVAEIPEAEIMARARTYGLEEIAAEEADRRREAEERRADYRRRLVEDPVLVLPLQEIQKTFNPNAVIPLGEHGTVYPTLTLRDRWGTLIVESGGALITADFTRATAPRAPGSACAPTGPGWTLELAEGWSLLPGERPNDCTVAEPPEP